MWKALLAFGLSFFSYFSFGFSGAGMCYSPTQMAALMSQPKKGESRKTKIKNIEKAIRELNKDLNKQEGKLADSLNESLLGEDKFDVAGKIREYIEYQENGWDCPENQSSLGPGQNLFSRSGFLKTAALWEGSPAFFLALWPELGAGPAKALSASLSPQLFFALAELFIPPAYSETPKGGAVELTPAVEADNSADQDLCINSGGEWQSLDPKAPKTCVCPNNTTWDATQGCVLISAARAAVKCSRMGRVWNKAQNKCCPSGQKVKDGKCVIKPDPSKKFKEKCKGAQGARWDGKKCVCPENKVFKDGKCVVSPSPADTGALFETLEPCKADKNSPACKKKTCSNQNRIWNPEQNKCCASGEKVIDGQCKAPAEETGSATATADGDKKASEQRAKNGSATATADGDKKESEQRAKKGSATATADEDTAEPCPEWKKHKAFGKNGQVHSNFCDQYAKDKSDCKRALKNIRSLKKDIDDLDKTKEELKEAERSGDKDEEETEAGGLCFDCLKRVLAASQPTAGETVGNILSLFAGAGMGLAGYNIGKRAQYDANMLRIQQGYEAQHDYYSFAGAQAGFPFLAQGFHGLTRANTPVGGWACSPTVSPYGHSYNYQYGQGFNMPYY